MLKVPTVRKNRVRRRDPVRSVEVSYDCPYCSNRGIVLSLLHTDLSWSGDSLKNVWRLLSCDNGPCPRRGLLQKLKPGRLAVGY
jgi:hypothetical protein